MEHFAENYHLIGRETVPVEDFVVSTISHVSNKLSSQRTHSDANDIVRVFYTRVMLIVAWSDQNQVLTVMNIIYHCLKIVRKHSIVC